MSSSLLESLKKEIRARFNSTQTLEMEQKVRELEADKKRLQTDLKKRVDDLELAKHNLDTTLQARINVLEHENKVLQKNFKDVSKKAKKRRTVISRRNKEIGILNQRIITLEMENESYKLNEKETQEGLNSIFEMIKKRKRSNEEEENMEMPDAKRIKVKEEPGVTQEHDQCPLTSDSETE